MASHAEQQDFSACTELIIVCCHATYTGDGSPLTETDWILQPFQKADPATKKPSEVRTFSSHILAGHMLCQAHPGNLLIFSGGRTTESGRSEAESYLKVYRRLQPKSASDGSRVLCALEEHATDSYQNLLFSILRFRTLTGRYPETVTVVTHAFKERRFLELHAAAIKWPLRRLRVQGVDPPFTLEELEQTQKSEHERAYKLFADDHYGVRPPLADKRKARNWDEAVLEGLAVDEAVKQLLQWQGGKSGMEIFPDALPWEET